jgi:hypothetical protein
MLARSERMQGPAKVTMGSGNGSETALTSVPAAGPPEAEHKYTMKISRLTIEQLGIKLYDKVSAVLAELIANAYDADAENVTVALPIGAYLAKKESGAVVDLGLEIRITDDGHGMTTNEVNEAYLKVGTNRRVARGEFSRDKQRPVMGRKGIGKLAPFGICREIEVISAGGKPDAKGYSVANFILRYDQVVSDVGDDYFPDVGPLDGTKVAKPGTTIVLKRFDRRRVPDRESLERQLAARFGISRDDWQVTVRDTLAVDPMFTIGELHVPTLADTKIELAGRPVPIDDKTTLPVKGWIAYGKTSYKDETMAGIRIYARGKIVAQTRDFEITSGFTGEYKLRSYLVGVVEADWLDAGDDLIRSDRQDIIWNSEYGEALKHWGQALIRELAKAAETSVRGRIWDEFLEKSKIESRAAGAFPGDTSARQAVIQAAKALVKGTDRDQINSDPDYVQSLVDLAFAIGPHRELLDTLQTIAEDESTTLGTLIQLFNKARVAETYSLGQVAGERVKALDRLYALISDGATLEDQLQRLIEGAPWILAAQWTPITMNRSLEEFRVVFEAWYLREHKSAISTTTIGRPTKKPDFIMLSLENSLEIIEIKRPNHAMTDKELERALGYLNVMREFCDAHPEIAKLYREPHLTIVCDSNAFKSPVSASAVKEPGVTWRTWPEVLKGSRQAHQDFLEEVRRMQGLLPAKVEVHSSEE